MSVSPRATEKPRPVSPSTSLRPPSPSTGSKGTPRAKFLGPSLVTRPGMAGQSGKDRDYTMESITASLQPRPAPAPWLPTLRAPHPGEDGRFSQVPGTSFPPGAPKGSGPVGMTFVGAGARQQSVPRPMSTASGSSVSEIVGFKAVGKVDLPVLPGKGALPPSTDLWGAWRPGAEAPPKGGYKGKSQEPPKGKGKITPPTKGSGKGKITPPTKGTGKGKGPANYY
jgi:hypothetical protein